MSFLLNLFNFRLFDKKQFVFDKPIIFITGKNQSGKSSIVESIYIIKTGRSFRTNSLNNCIKEKEKFFSIELKNKDNEKLIYNDQGIKSYFINDEKSKHDLVNPNIFILYNKNLFNFIFQTDFRRRTIDELISSYDKKYLFYLLHCKKIVEKKKEIIYSNIDYNTKKNLYFNLLKSFAEYTKYINEKRREMINQFDDFISKNSSYKIIYQSKFDNLNTDKIIEFYDSNFQIEIEQKKYLGPHNDYYILIEKGKKLIENGATSDFYKFYFLLFYFFINKIKIEQNTNPIILFDDFFLPLDLSSTNNLISYFDNDFTIFISQHDSFKIEKDYCEIRL